METEVVKKRRERLRELIARRYGGKQSRMVEDTGINAGELSGLLRAKHFGEKKARALEKQLGLEAMWLDGDVQAPVVPNADLLRIWEYLLPSQQDEFLEKMRPLAEFNKEVAAQFSAGRAQKVNVLNRRKQQVHIEFPDRRTKGGDK